MYASDTRCSWIRNQRQNLGLALDGFCWKRYTDVRDGGDTCCSHHPHRRQDSHKRFQQVQSRVANGNDIVYLKKVTT